MGADGVWRRIRWGNVARLGALVALGLMVAAWPRLGGGPPRVPSGAAVPVVGGPARAVEGERARPRAKRAAGREKRARPRAKRAAGREKRARPRAKRRARRVAVAGPAERRGRGATGERGAGGERRRRQGPGAAEGPGAGSGAAVREFGLP